MRDEVLSIRIEPKEKKEITEFIEEEGAFKRSDAARKLLHIGLREWKIRKSLEKLSKGYITLSKAAELSGISIWEMAGIVKEKKITWVKPSRKQIEKDIKAAFS